MAPLDEMDDSIRRHPSSLAPPERHRRFGPWGILVAAVSAAALITAGVLAVTLGRGSPGPTATELMGGPAPEFELTTLDGKRVVRLSELRGHVVVVTFDEAGCAPCRNAEAALDRAWRHFRPQGVVVVGVRKDPPPSVAANVATPGPWPVVADPHGTTAGKYGVHEIPETFVISPEGRVVAGLAGPVTYPLLVAQISSLLGLPDPTDRDTSTPETSAAS